MLLKQIALFTAPDNFGNDQLNNNNKLEINIWFVGEIGNRLTTNIY